MIGNNKNILILSPHTDDAELGAGGTIARFVDEGHNIKVMAYANCDEGPIDRFYKSMDILGVSDFEFLNYERRTLPDNRKEILDSLYKLNKQTSFDLVIIPSTADIHQDHQVVTQETIRTFRSSTILGYEFPWNNEVFRSNCFINLAPEHIERKLKAIEFYESQSNKRFFSKKVQYARAMVRALNINTDLAEAFELIKLVIK